MRLYNLQQTKRVGIHNTEHDRPQRPLLAMIHPTRTGYTINSGHDTLADFSNNDNAYICGLPMYYSAHAEEKWSTWNISMPGVYKFRRNVVHTPVVTLDPVTSGLVVLDLNGYTLGQSESMSSVIRISATSTSVRYAIAIVNGGIDLTDGCWLRCTGVPPVSIFVQRVRIRARGSLSPCVALPRALMDVDTSRTQCVAHGMTCECAPDVHTNLPFLYENVNNQHRRASEPYVHLDDDRFQQMRYHQSSPLQPSYLELLSDHCALHGRTAQDEDVTPTVNNLFWLFGQFIDHTLVQVGPSPSDAKMTLHLRSGVRRESTMSMSRSAYPVRNMLAPFVDASSVYGSTPERELALRDSETGRLRTSGIHPNTLCPRVQELRPGIRQLVHESILPVDTLGGGNVDVHFFQGDARSNEHQALTALHTLFVREHNRLYDILSREYPGCSEETLYYMAKEQVRAHIQYITFDEFVPTYLGEPLSRPSALPSRLGMSVSFVTSVFRTTHTMVNALGELKIADLFFRASTFTAEMVDKLLGLACTTPSLPLDTHMTEDLRLFLFGTQSGHVNEDLFIRNMFRGYDHGLQYWSELRYVYEFVNDGHVNGVDVTQEEYDGMHAPDAFATIRQVLDESVGPRGWNTTSTQWQIQAAGEAAMRIGATLDHLFRGERDGAAPPSLEFVVAHHAVLQCADGQSWSLVHTADEVEDMQACVVLNMPSFLGLLLETASGSKYHGNASAIVGPTIGRILNVEFSRFRDSDPMYHGANPFFTFQSTPGIDRVIQRNTSVTADHFRDPEVRPFRLPSRRQTADPGFS